MPPWKVRDSPTITVPIRNCTTSPLQYQQGASVVTMMVSRVASLSAGLAKRVGLAVHRRIAFLHAAIVAAA